MATKLTIASERRVISLDGNTQLPKPAAFRSLDAAPAKLKIDHPPQDQMSLAGRVLATRDAASSHDALSANAAAGGRLRPGNWAGRAAAAIGLLASLPASAASRLGAALAPTTARVASAAPGTDTMAFQASPRTTNTLAVAAANWANATFNPPVNTYPAAPVVGSPSNWNDAPETSYGTPAPTTTLAIVVGVGVGAAIVFGGTLAIFKRRREWANGTNVTTQGSEYPTVVREASVGAARAADIELGIQGEGPAVVVVHPAAS